MNTKKPKKTRIYNVKYLGMLKLSALYAVTLGLLYGAFWFGFYLLQDWAGVVCAILLVGATSTLLAVFRKKMWSAALSCLSVSVGIGLAISTFYVILDVEPSRFFGLVLLIVLVYKSLQNFLMAKLSRKTLLTVLYIILELVAAIVFFVLMDADIGLYSQIGFACVVAVFLSFGQLALYKYGANDVWRTIALSYIIGFAFIALFVVILVLSILSEDGSGFEIFGAFGEGAINGGTGKKKKKLKP